MIKCQCGLVCIRKTKQHFKTQSYVCIKRIILLFILILWNIICSRYDIMHGVESCVLPLYSLDYFYREALYISKRQHFDLKLWLFWYFIMLYNLFLSILLYCLLIYIGENSVVIVWFVFQRFCVFINVLFAILFVAQVYVFLNIL